MLIKDFAKTSYERGWLIRGLLPKNHIILNCGSPHSGKSYIAEYYGLCVASGRDCLGLPVNRGPVILIDEDTPTDELQERLVNLAAGFEVDLNTLPFWVHTFEGLRLDDDMKLYGLIEEVKRVHPSLVILDCLAKMMGKFDENSAKDCNAAATVWASIRACGTTVFVNHQLNKREGKINSDFTKLVRGSVALVASCDTAFAMERGRETDSTTTFNVFPVERRRRLEIRQPFGIEVEPLNKGLTLKKSEIRKQLSQLALDIWPLFYSNGKATTASLSVNAVKRKLNGYAADHHIRQALGELYEANLIKRGRSAHNRYIYTCAIP